MTAPIIKTGLDTTYPQEYNLDRIDTLIFETPNVFGKCPYFSVDNLPNVLTFGKHYFTISFKVPTNTLYHLKPNSKILFEFKDENGTVIFSDLTTLNNVNGAALGYVWLQSNPIRTFKDVKNGMGTFTIVAQFMGVPDEWKNVFNYKVQWPIEIRKDLPNTSPILFQSSSLINSSLSISESVELDINTGESTKDLDWSTRDHFASVAGQYRKARIDNRKY